MDSQEGDDRWNNVLVGQRHFVALVCRKWFVYKVLRHGISGSGRHDLILLTSIPRAFSRLSLVFV